MEDIEVVKFLDSINMREKSSMLDVVYYPEDSTKENLVLIELEGEMLEYSESGGEFYIQGQPNSQAVLCTQTETFKIHMRETSNSIFVVPKPPPSQGDPDRVNLTYSRGLLGPFSYILDVVKSGPNKKDLKSLLKQFSYPKVKDSPLNFDYLLQIAQCSKTELGELLSSLKAITTISNVYILDRTYFQKCVIQIISVLDSKCWDYRNFPLDVMVNELSQLYPSFVVEHVLRSTMVPQAENEATKGLKLDDYTTQREIASHILSPIGCMERNDFTTTCQISLPRGMLFDETYLRGIAVISDDELSYLYLCADEMSDAPSERMEKLFSEKKEWSYNEIEPYVEDLTGETISKEKILEEYTSKYKNIRGETVFVRKTSSLIPN